MAQAEQAIASTPTTFKLAQPTRHIDSLRAGPDNPRDEIDPADPKIIELSYSIEQNGIIEPLVIKPDGELIAGHRRRAACRVAAKRAKRSDLLIVPVVIREVAPGAELELMLQENMQRQSLSPLEEARGMYLLMERKCLTVGDLARTIAVPTATCSSRLAILKCELDVQRLYAANELPLQAASVLAYVDNAEKQISYAGMLARRTITFQQLKEMVRKDPHTRQPANARTRSIGGQDASETTADIPKPKRQAQLLHGEKSKSITRAEAEAALNKVLTQKISMHAVRSVLEATCCACGMKGQEEVCVSCPLPRIVLGIAGRAGL